jgi:hypothetical protein
MFSLFIKVRLGRKFKAFGRSALFVGFKRLIQTKNRADPITKNKKVIKL